jgi:hypothetical protein
MALRAASIIPLEWLKSAPALFAIMKILIVEDERKTTSYLKRGLEENGFTLMSSTTSSLTFIGTVPLVRDMRC